ncbi:MAG: hypothetical protein J6Z36_04390, partial [Clostridia bacterium]|nr:hypothetical protein [Clostridia bacterium]
MEKIAFTDGTKLCLLDENGNLTARESGFIARYKENARRRSFANEWKYSGMGYRFQGGSPDYDDFDDDDGDKTIASLNGITFIEENTIAYSFTVDGSSGIYKKYFTLEKEDESHVIHSNSEQFFSLKNDRKSGSLLATTAKTGEANSSLSVFGTDGDYNNLTDGDSKDENPVYSPVDGRILFDSAGVGRNARGGFVRYAPAGIYALDPLTLEMETIKEDKEYSYVKPKQDGQGNIYAIKRPADDLPRGNILVDILLIPVRIIEALVGFVGFFVEIFARKPLVKGNANTRGNNPARNRDERTVFIEGYRIETERELKKNSKNKEKDYG